MYPESIQEMDFALFKEYDIFFWRFLSKYFPYIFDDFLKFGSGLSEISAIVNHQICLPSKIISP